MLLNLIVERISKVCKASYPFLGCFFNFPHSKIYSVLIAFTFTANFHYAIAEGLPKDVDVQVVKNQNEKALEEKGMDLQKQKDSQKDFVDDEAGSAPVGKVDRKSVVQKLFRGRDGRPKFAFGLGVSAGFIESFVAKSEFTNKGAYEIESAKRVGPFLNIYAKFNIFDLKYFSLAFVISYFDEIVSDMERVHISSLLFEFFLNSNIAFNLNIGVNLGRMFTVYAIAGMNGMFISQSYSMNNISSDSLSWNPSFGIGMEMRLNRFVGIKAEFVNIFLSNNMSPELHQTFYALESLYVGHGIFGIHVYI